MSALMIGCLIPISLGLFPNWAGMIQLILVLSGLAGILLFGGVIQLIYAETLPDTLGTTETFQVIALPGVVPTNQLPPADEPEPIPSVAEHTTGLLADVSHERKVDRV